MNAMSHPIASKKTDDRDAPQERRGKALSPNDSHTGEHLSASARDQFQRDVLAGLQSNPKTLPCKYFYDTRGSELFEQICETPEYYVTRTEIELLRQACPQVAKLAGPGIDVLEPGSGAGEKIRILLDSLDNPRSFIPIDISKSAVAASAEALQRDYPAIDVHPLVADFTRPLHIPPHFFERRKVQSEEADVHHRKMIFFPGSTISNFVPSEALPFLQGLGGALEPGDFLFIGVDRVKDHQTLERAYDDAAGVTAAFNLNLLSRIRFELETDLDPDLFAHKAVYNADESRIEMHLVAQEAHGVRLCGRSISFAEGETIHTENSYKYTPEAFTKLAENAGFEVVQTYTDPENLFSLYLCQVPG